MEKTMTINIAPTMSGLRHMRGMFLDQKMKAEVEAAECASLIALLDQRVDTLTFITEEGDRIRLNCSQMQLIVRALEDHERNEALRAEEMDRAYDECDACIKKAEEEGK